MAFLVFLLFCSEETLEETFRLGPTDIGVSTISAILGPLLPTDKAKESTWSLIFNILTANVPPKQNMTCYRAAIVMTHTFYTWV